MPGRKWESNVIGVAALTTAQTIGSVAHGLNGTPTFVLATVGSIVNAGAGVGHVTWTATGTTVTFTTASTAGTKSINYLIAL